MLKNPRWARYWSSRVVVNIATIGGMGSLKAPGTWGSAMGIVFYACIVVHMSDFAAALFLACAGYFAIGICGEAEKRLKKVDPGEIILDEFVSMPICLVGLNTFMGQSYSAIILLAAFILFRIFDIVKPFGIKKLQRYHGGFGVVADDIAAGIAVAVILNIGVRIWVV